MSASHRVTEVERPGPLDHGGVLEHDVSADELAEVADARAKQHRHLADAELVDEAEVQRLLDDFGAGDRDELVAGDFLRRRDRLLDAAGEGRPGEPLSGVFRWRTVGHDDHWGTRGVVVAPAVGLVEEATAGDQCAAARRELLQHRRACGINREAHALLRAWHHDVARPVPVEQLRRVVVGLGDEPVQRHAHVSQHLGHAPTTRLAPQSHRSTTQISGEPPMHADGSAVRASRTPSLATSVGSDQRIWLGGQWFNVAGILQPSPLEPDIDNSALISYPTAQKYLGYVSMVRGEGEAGPPSSIYVRTAIDHVAAV